MDASAFFAQGNAAFVDEQFEEARQAYTVAIETEPNQAAFLLNRAAACLKLGDFVAAKEDADAAAGLLPTGDSKRALASLRAGTAAFYLGDYRSAQASFAACGTPAAQVWTRKCEAELSGSILPLKGLVAAPASAAPTPAPAPAPTPAPAAAAYPAASRPAEEKTQSVSGRKPIKHEFYQTPTHVVLTILAKKCSDDQVSTEQIADDELAVSITLPGDGKEEYQLHLDLFGPVKNIQTTVSAVKVEVKMEKAASGDWRALEKVSQAELDKKVYPSSNKVKKDWSTIDKECEAELKADKPEGDEALNTLFKDIYKNANEETRRAMVKSFQTSGGTVLSTNWGDVGKADYEGKDRPSAPEGQKWANE